MAAVFSSYFAGEVKIGKKLHRTGNFKVKGNGLGNSWDLWHRKGIDACMWCVVHVRDNGEEHMEDFIAGLLPGGIYARCFHLIRGRRKKYEGQWHIVYENLFPGYVFIDTDEPERVYKELKKTAGPKLLFSDDEYVCTLEKHESDFMERLVDRDGRIGISRVRIGGDGRIRCLSGPLKHMEDRVRRINLHKRIVEIEAEVMGKKRVLYLGIDIVEDDRRKAEAS